MIEQKLPLHYPARLNLKSGIKETHLGLDVNDLQGVIYRFLSRLKALKVVHCGSNHVVTFLQKMTRYIWTTFFM